MTDIAFDGFLDRLRFAQDAQSWLDQAQQRGVAPKQSHIDREAARLIEGLPVGEHDPAAEPPLESLPSSRLEEATTQAAP